MRPGEGIAGASCLLWWCEQHDIRVMGVEIHRGVEVCTQTSFKWAAHRLMTAHPFAQLDY